MDGQGVAASPRPLQAIDRERREKEYRRRRSAGKKGKRRKETEKRRQKWRKTIWKSIDSAKLLGDFYNARAEKFMRETRRTRAKTSRAFIFQVSILRGHDRGNASDLLSPTGKNFSSPSRLTRSNFHLTNFKWNTFYCAAPKLLPEHFIYIVPPLSRETFERKRGISIDEDPNRAALNTWSCSRVRSPRSRGALSLSLSPFGATLIVPGRNCRN